MREKIGIGLTLALVLGTGFAKQGRSVHDGIAALASSSNGSPVVAGQDGWLFFGPELHYLSAGKFWGDDAAKVSKSPAGAQDPLPAILDFKSQLDKKGITLLVVPVPGKAAIYPDKLIAGAKPTVAGRADAAQAEFLKVLNSNGVKTLDLTPIFLNYRQQRPTELLYTKTDTHWSGNGISVTADELVKIVKQQPWYPGVPKTKYSPKLNVITASGDLAKMQSESSPATESIRLTTVNAPSTGKSPLLLLGDSHNLVYSIGGDMLAKSSGLPENLALRLGFAPDVVGVMGSGATPARVNIARRPELLAGKRMVIWVFTSRDFTESAQGWRKVPVIR